MTESDPTAAARRELLAKAWDDAAPGYDRYFVPRFAPWTDQALRVLSKEARRLPAGPVLVPCCGPGQELIFLATHVARLGCLLFFLVAVEEPGGKPLRAVVVAAQAYAKSRFGAFKMLLRDE